MLKKCKYNKQDINLYLLNYRNTPLCDVGVSPSQLLQSRSLRTKLPIDEKLLTPKLVNLSEIEEKINNSKLKQKINYDKNSKITEVEFTEGEHVLLRNIKRNIWEKAKIIKKLEFKSYLVECNGGVYRRNVKFIKKF